MLTSANCSGNGSFSGWITRDEIYVSSKLNNPYHQPEHVKPMLEKSLLDLKIDQVDMYLMHWFVSKTLENPRPASLFF